MSMIYTHIQKHIWVWDLYTYEYDLYIYTKIDLYTYEYDLYTYTKTHISMMYTHIQK